VLRRTFFHSCGLRRPPLAVQLVAVRVKKKTAVQEQQRQAERAHDNCRRDVEQQAAANEELSSELQVPSARLRLGVVWRNACAAIAAAAEVDGISGGNAGA
jgi:hypothetical protein